MIAQLDKAYCTTSCRNIYQRVISYLFFEGRPLTTKGRWINPLVFCLLNRLKNSYREDIKQPIFIVGIGRSGTTLLGKILSAHRDVGYLNEPKAIWHTVFPREDLNGNYSNGPAHYKMNEHDASLLQREQIHAIYYSYLKLTGSKRLVDKYPELVFRTSLVKYLFPDARLLLIVRSGNDVLQSINQWSKDKGTADAKQREDWWGLDNRKWKLLLEQIVSTEKDWRAIRQQVAGYTSHLDMAAVEWIASMRAGMAAEVVNPGMIKRIYYEELIHKPKATLKTITSFTGLSEDNTMMDYALSLISPIPVKDEPIIDKALHPLFRETMIKLGYRY